MTSAAPAVSPTNVSSSSSVGSTATANATANANANTPHTASLYVGDIHPEVVESTIFEIFNAVGPVASVRVCRDAITRRSLGYAYVNYHNVVDAERAIDAMNYTPIKGIPCRIMWSQRDPSIRKSGVGNIFVKNLDTSIDNKALYDTFSLFGNILSCKVAIDETSGQSKGYGYVHYETAEAANEAISKTNGMLIAGQEVFCGFFQKRAERSELSEWTNCFVKNLPKQWTEEDLQKEFQVFGPLASCVIMKDNESNETESEDSAPTQSRGFGFVNFEAHDDAVKAVEVMNKKVCRSMPDDVDVEIFVGKAQKRTDRERELRGRFEALKLERINKYQGVNLYVKNVDDQMTDEELREFFNPYGVITSCQIMRDTNGTSKGFGFVCYSLPEEATKAVTELNGKLILGKPIYVALAQRKEVRRAQLEAHHAQRAVGIPTLPPRAIAMGQPSMYGAAPMFYAQPNQMNGPRPGFVYPSQMMGQVPRGLPRGGPMPYSAGRPVVNQYPMPAAYGMQMQPRHHQARRGRPQNAYRQGNSTAPQNRNFKYTANARNQPMRDGNVAGMNMPPMNGNGQVMPPGAPVMVNQADAPHALTSASLAAASPADQKNMIGERLYPLIHREQPELAGKITGMLLEMDNGELLHLLESPEALNAKIGEALEVLEAHSTEPKE